MSSNSSQNENEFSHRQGSVTSLPEEDDQITINDSNPSPTQQQQRLTSSNGYSKVPSLDDSQSFHIENEYQTATIDLQTVPDISIEDNINPNWTQLSREASVEDHRYHIASQSDSIDDITESFGFPQQQLNSTANLTTEISSTTDYKTFLQSQKLYFDPDPELIRKPQMIAPLIYKQNVTVKFLKPPPIPLGPLIIREVRPPQPPPPPPLVIRQRPPPPLSPPPIILREKPPQVPAIMTAQVLTKTLPPIPPPPRSVIIEKLPPLPPKPRDIIIERWIPYESTTYKRKVVVQRAAEFKPYPPPKNVIITYDKVEAKVIRQFERYGIKPADPEYYSTLYGDSLLDTNMLLAKARELGITEDLSLPNLINHEFKEKLTSNPLEQNYSYENPFLQNNFEKRPSNSSFSSDKIVYSNIDNNTYAATYENLINASSPSINYDELNEYLVGQENIEGDLSTQLAQYGLTTESIPY